MNYKNIYGRLLDQSLADDFSHFAEPWLTHVKNLEIESNWIFFQNFQLGLLYKISKIKFYISR